MLNLMNKGLYISAVLILTAASAFASGFDDIKPANPLDLPVQKTEDIIQINKPQKASLTKNDVHNHYAVALERFIQCNVRSSYADFRILIESIVPNDYAYMLIANKMADLGFFSLSDLALSKVTDEDISYIMNDDIQRYYYPSYKLNPKDEIYLAEMFSNIMYNAQSLEAASELVKNTTLLEKSDYANYIVALGLLKANNINNAKKYIDIAINKNPQNLNYKKLKAEIALQDNKTKTALKIVEEMKQAPVMNEFYINKTYSLEQYVLYKAAKQDYEKKYHLGYYYYYEGELNKAMRTLQTATSSKKKNNADTYALIARVYFDMKEYEKAGNFAEKTLNIQSNNVMALIVMGDISVKDKDFKTAYKYYNKAYSGDKKSIAPAIRLAETARKLDKLDTTRDIYSKILKTRSDCPQAYYNVAMTDATRKLEYLKKAVALDSNFTEGWLELSKMMIDMQNFAAAKKYLAIAKYIDENNFKYYYYQGLICKSQGLIQDAVYNFKKSLSINPDFKPAKEELSI